MTGPYTLLRCNAGLPLPRGLRSRPRPCGTLPGRRLARPHVRAPGGSNESSERSAGAESDGGEHRTPANLESDAERGRSVSRGLWHSSPRRCQNETWKSVNLAWAVRISGDGGQEGRHLAKKMTLDPSGRRSLAPAPPPPPPAPSQQTLEPGGDRSDLGGVRELRQLPSSRSSQQDDTLYMAIYLLSNTLI